MAVEASPPHIPAMPTARRRPTPSTDASVAPAAALLADPARVAMLWALIDGRALPAGELARAAGVSPSTASAHLGRLVAARWVGAEDQGRHRYMRLINPDVAGLLEALAVVGGPPPEGPGVKGGPPDELRLARKLLRSPRRAGRGSADGGAGGRWIHHRGRTDLCRDPIGARPTRRTGNRHRGDRGGSPQGATVPGTGLSRLE